MSYEVTLLVFGILLLLVGLLGKVKAKEIEVGTSSRIVRIVLSLLGIVFVVSSFNPDIIKSFLPTPPNQTDPGDTTKRDSTGIVGPTSPKDEIKSGMQVYFLHASGLIGDPQTANNGWDAGTFGITGGSHQVVTANGQALKNGIFVRIITDSKTLAADDYKYMYSAVTGWVYYDKIRDNGKEQLWKISVVGVPPDGELHYGDRVKISNGYWPKANLGKKGKWLQCVNDDATIWILSKEPGKVSKK
ncbi:MAG: hypothetical protein O6943_13955 [Bacteroidetes bacterium]|nr:hypothetical protein [Bacteroidota bacterium]